MTTQTLPKHRLTHLRQLEAESIHIIREVAAEFEKPVMLFSIGKDSLAMLRLAEKAFAPAKLPFPLLHVNTTFKFKEMISFRDNVARERVFELLDALLTEAVHLGFAAEEITAMVDERLGRYQWAASDLQRQ